MGYKVIHHIGAVSLSQAAPDVFKVVYGQQIKEPLSYAAAAKEYGLCIFHQLACEGVLDNRARNEK